MRLCTLPLLTLALLSAAHGQMAVDTIHVRLLNGRSGKPVKRARAIVTVFPKTKYEVPVEYTADRGGSFSLLAQHAAAISTRVERYRPCEQLSKAAQIQPPTPFPVAAITTTGVESPNTCGRQHTALSPGTLTLYIRTPPWWKPFF